MSGGAVQGTEAAARRPKLPVWLIVLISGVFALLYAYVVWTALGFLIQQAGGSEGLSGYGWFVLILPVIFPLVVFGAAFAIGWRRSAGQFAIVLLTGLALIAAFWLNVFAYAAASTSLYGA